jgi:hypothetical protein
MVSRRRFLYGSAATAFVAGCSGGFSPDTAGPLFAANALFHYIATGQSLAIGVQGGPVLSTTQPFQNVMFTFPNQPFAVNDPVTYNAITLGYSGIAFRPLLGGPSVSGEFGTTETIANGFADSLSAEFAGYRQLLSCSGVSGATYAELAGPTAAPPNGTEPFQEMMSQVSNGFSLAKAAGLSYSVPAMLLIHGEYDAQNNTYNTDLVTWQSDMQNGVNAITGGSAVIPILAAQTQAPAFPIGNANTSPYHPGAGNLGLLAASIANPELIYVACPEYMMAHHYYMDPTGQTIHMTNDGYRHLGLMMAKAASYLCIQKKGWSPLVPKQVTLQGTSVKIEYNVPYGPLVIDTSYVTDPGNYGFNFSDNPYNVTSFTNVTQVQVTGPAEITLTLSAPSAGGYLCYAMIDPGPASGGAPYGQGFGPTAGPRGCVRDSDPAISYYKNSVTGLPYPMQNYSVAWQTLIQQGKTLPFPS